MTNGTLDTTNIPVGARQLNFVGRRPVNSGDKVSGWKRTAILETLSYWIDESNTPLFSHEPTVNDLKQRTISNCYMISAVSGLVEISPEFLKSCIRDNEDGTVTVRLYDKKQNPPDKQIMENLKNKDYSKEIIQPATKEERADALINSLYKVYELLHPSKPDAVQGGEDDFEGVELDDAKINYTGLEPAVYRRIDKLLDSVLRCHDINLARKDTAHCGMARTFWYASPV